MLKACVTTLAHILCNSCISDVLTHSVNPGGPVPKYDYLCIVIATAQQHTQATHNTQVYKREQGQSDPDIQ